MTVINEDCVSHLRSLSPSQFDACVTDPPYELGFMGREWDRSGVSFRAETWDAVRRSLKPGAFLLAFGGSRTFHRIAAAIEDGGFELRDTLCWLYGQGFPKGKSALKPAWEPIIMARKPVVGSERENIAEYGTGGLNIEGCRIETDISASRRADIGFGAGLKAAGIGYKTGSDLGRWPANVILDDAAAELLDAQGGERPSGARAGLQGRALGGVYGDYKGVENGKSWEADSGGASRFFKIAGPSESESFFRSAKAIMGEWNPELANTADNNSILSSEAVASALRLAVIAASQGAMRLGGLLELTTNVTPMRSRALCEIVTAMILSFASESSRGQSPGERIRSLNLASDAATLELIDITTTTTVRLKFDGCAALVTLQDTSMNSAPGAPVFQNERFRYCAKASSAERDAGLEHMNMNPRPGIHDDDSYAHPNGQHSVAKPRANDHPTVKPLAMMRWLVRLATPPGGLVLDPFLGSGTTALACLEEGLGWYGIDDDAHACDIARGRIEGRK